jgi:HK97 family phage portal protein
MNFNINISRKGFTINRQPGQNISTSLLLPRTSYDYEAQVNGWQSAIIMACVGWAQRTFPEAPLMVEKMADGGEWEMVPHQMLDLLEEPNPYYDGLLLQMGLIADWMIDGNGYYRKVRSNAGRVVELWWTPSYMIEPQWPYDNSTFISHYRYYPGGAPVDLKPDDVVHFRNGVDSRNTRKGLSPLKSLFREVFSDDEAANMTAALLKNLGVPGIMFSPETSVNPEDAEAIKEKIKEKTTGDKRGEPFVFHSKANLTQFGFSPQQLDLKVLRRIPEERVTAVLGIPAIVAGLGAGLDRATYANYSEAREAAYESYIIPTQRLIASVLKRQLLRDFEDDITQYRVGYDLSDIRILQEDENKLVERTNAMVNGGYLKLIDAQRMTGAPVDDSQDFYLRKFTDVPTPSGQPMPPVQTEQPQSNDNEEPVKAAKKSLSDEGKEAYWKSYAAKAEGYEKGIIPALRGMFGQQEKEVLANLNAGQRDNLLNRSNAKKLYKDKVAPPLTQLMAEAFQDARGMVSKAAIPPVLNQAALAWLKTRLGWAAEQVGEETANLLAQSLAEGFRLGETIDDLAKRVKSVFDFCESYRAERIARTETIAASNIGAVEGYKEVGVTKTEWYAALDERLCPICETLHGKVSPISEGEVPPAHVSCRCTVLPVLD